MQENQFANSSQQASSNLNELLSTAICPMEYRLGTTSAPWGVRHFGGINLPGISLYRNESFGNIRGVRTRVHISEDRIDDFLVSIPLDVVTCVRQSSVTSYCNPGSFSIVSLETPFASSISAKTSRASYSELLARISASALRQLVPGIDLLSSRPIKIHPGTGGLMKSMFEWTLSNATSASERHPRGISDMLIRSVAHSVLSSPEYESTLTGRKSSLTRVIDMAKDFIERNLSDPTLSRKQVATHCHVSERYLHKSFEAHSTTVCDFIRNSRLERCRAAIRDPGLQNQSIYRIASWWGFVDQSSFTKIYKRQFAVTPNHDRLYVSSKMKG